jgi:fatty-acyl-CoA synthase
MDLVRNPANYVALSPVSFLTRAALVFPHKTAVIHGDKRYTYAQLLERCVRLASGLSRLGVAKGDTVAVLAPNVPALLECHYGVPMVGAVLNTINTRLDAATVRFILRHGKARVFLVEREYAEVARSALSDMADRPFVVDIDDAAAPQAQPVGRESYEELLAKADPRHPWSLPDDEWQTIALNYTSGTTGDPKAVVYHHRGAYLNAMGNVLAFGLSPESVYLWTLPMFHCNGWCYTWAVTLAGGTHVCLRQIDPGRIFELIGRHRVTHLCGAPVVLNLLIHSPERPTSPFAHPVHIATGGAAPPSAVIEAMEAMGIRVTHLYGLTETYGPSTLCEWQSDWDGLPLAERALKNARQGVPMPTIEAVAVLDAQGRPVPADGATLGELCIRGNTVMKGYLDNDKATSDAFRNGWFHSGDLAVVHEDGYVEIKDRLKDIIISGGENISTLEVEEVLYRHPSVFEAAVVAKPDDKWGETPCAFITLKAGVSGLDPKELIAWCRERLAGYKIPRHIVFEALPKTATGKIQKHVLRERARLL